MVRPQCCDCRLTCLAFHTEHLANTRKFEHPFLNTVQLKNIRDTRVVAFSKMLIHQHLRHREGPSVLHVKLKLRRAHPIKEALVYDHA